LEQLANNLNNTERSIRSNNPNDYEELLQKLEGDIRNHIKIQHQYRIYTDSLKHKIEEIEKLNNEQKNLIGNLNEVKFILKEINFCLYFLLFYFSLIFFPRNYIKIPISRKFLKEKKEKLFI